jgi:hypothetical protein
MAQTLLNGATQIKSGSISLDRLVSGWDAALLKKDGSVALTADWNAGSSGTFAITGIKDAVNATDAVNLRTLQAFESGMGLRANARMVAVANVTPLSGVQNFDGVTAAAGDVVLLTGQTTAAQNGPWVQAAGAWTRPAFWSAASSQRPALFFITEGTTYDNTKWTTTTNGLITVDTTSVTITQDTSGTSYTNGSGLSLTGNTFAVKNGNGISFDGSQNVQVVGNATALISVTASGVGLTNGTAAQFPVMNAGATAPVWVSMSGDVSIAASGAATVNNTAGTGFLKYANVVSNETVGGTVNGANTAFTLAFTPQVSSLMLYLNGVVLEPGAGNDYTIAGTAITMLFAPATGDKLRAYYIK